MIRLEKIVVPTDFSESSEEALCYAGALARRYGAKVILLHVMESDIMGPLRAVDGGLDLIRKVRRDRENSLEKLSQEDILAGMEVEHRIEEGLPAYEIIETAKASGADLITMGTHGRTGPERVFFGSVAERVVRTSPLPVLTVRRPEHGFVECSGETGPTITLKNILLPTDFSETSAHAARYAIALAREYEACLHVLHVVSTPGVVPGGLKPSEGEREREAEESLQEFMKERLAGLDVVREIKRGVPFGEIVTEGRKKEADLVVMGTHGRTFLAYALLGSVTSKVVRSSPCPVLTVRHPEHKFQKL